MSRAASGPYQKKAHMSADMSKVDGTLPSTQDLGNFSKDVGVGV